ncbi:hypothetical protein TNCV_1438771 [Trichonephila clavipes]|nr:hypothetical protein TNCV_1438771 [Trichonephila clavipes]
MLAEDSPVNFSAWSDLGVSTSFSKIRVFNRVSGLVAQVFASLVCLSLTVDAPCEEIRRKTIVLLHLERKFKFISRKHIILIEPSQTCMHLSGGRKQNEESKKRIRRVIASRYEELGTITFHESAVLCLFVILVLLWIFREPKFIRGWAELISADTRIGDAVPVIGVLFLLFLFPAEPWRMRDSDPLLKWSAVQKKLPWGLVILLGGGFALAAGTLKSGLSKWLGAQMVELSILSPFVVQIILCVCTATLTEIMSNSTVATILLPVVNEMAIAFHVHPLYLMLPVTVVSSYAFMLPVATGPNAIAFDSGRMKTIEMIYQAMDCHFKMNVTFRRNSKSAAKRYRYLDSHLITEVETQACIPLSKTSTTHQREELESRQMEHLYTARLN